MKLDAMVIELIAEDLLTEISTLYLRFSINSHVDNSFLFAYTKDWKQRLGHEMDRIHIDLPVLM